MSPTINVFRTISALEEAACDVIVSSANASIRDRGIGIIALSGGETPRGVYRRLAMNRHSDRVDWTRVHLCFGDERSVPPDDAESNYRMVHTELLSRVSIPERNVHRIQGERRAEDAAHHYEIELANLLAGPADRLDLILLGVGEDGHTASLFAGTDVLDEQHAAVRAVFVPRLHAWRVTMTYPVLNNARDVLFLATGTPKAAIVQRVLSARRPLHDLPATMVRPVNGRLCWMIDTHAAAALGEKIVSR